MFLTSLSKSSCYFRCGLKDIRIKFIIYSRIEPGVVLSFTDDQPSSCQCVKVQERSTSLAFQHFLLEIAGNRTHWVLLVNLIKTKVAALKSISIVTYAHLPYLFEYFTHLRYFGRASCWNFVSINHQIARNWLTFLFFESASMTTIVYLANFVPFDGSDGPNSSIPETWSRRSHLPGPCSSREYIIKSTAHKDGNMVDISSYLIRRISLAFDGQKLQHQTYSLID